MADLVEAGHPTKLFKYLPSYFYFRPEYDIPDIRNRSEMLPNLNNKTQ